MIIGPKTIENLVHRYNGLGKELSADEKEIFLFALYCESEKRGGLVDKAVAQEKNPSRCRVPKSLELVNQAIQEAMERVTKLHPVEDWHEDEGCVLWHHVPVQEPPYVGSGPGAGEQTADGEPTECARLIEEGWLTHWSRLPQVTE